MPDAQGMLGCSGVQLAAEASKALGRCLFCFIVENDVLDRTTHPCFVERFPGDPFANVLMLAFSS